MKTRICAALALMLWTSTAFSQQMVSSHSSSLPAAAAKPASVAATAPEHKTAPSPGTMALSPAMTPTGKTVAKVNGAVLTDRDLLREMFAIFPYAQQHNGFPKELEEEIRKGALQMIIFEELVYQEAKRRNMNVSAAKLSAAEADFRRQFPTQAAYNTFLNTEANGSQAAVREKIRRSILIDQLMDQDVNNAARITLAQARSYYAKNSKEYEHADIYQFQSISIIPPNRTAAVQAEAKQRAEEAYKQAKLAKNYYDFGVLAEKLSDDDYHVKMGDHKPLEANKLPPIIVQTLSKMGPGDVSGLIQFDGNYTIVRLVKFTPAGKTPFDDVKKQLQSDMQKEKTQQLRSALAEKLRKNAKIETL
jgi:peptidyl-prolyl cis-trans isomerase SurA